MCVCMMYSVSIGVCVVCMCEQLVCGVVCVYDV